MRTSLIFIVLSILIPCFSIAQNDETMDKENTDLPYYQIPDYPEAYNAATVAARMIDGLGFRYYWATESLREEDLSFQPNEDARTVLETLDHTS